MKDDFNSYALRGLADAVEDALQSDCTPDEILDCFISSIKKNLNYHKVCARHSKVLDLLYGVDKKNNVVEINAGALSDDYLTDPKKWIDYTELPTGNVEINTENIGMFTEDELVAKGYQLTDTGWVKA